MHGPTDFFASIVMIVEKTSWSLSVAKDAAFAHPVVDAGWPIRLLI